MSERDINDRYTRSRPPAPIPRYPLEKTVIRERGGKTVIKRIGESVMAYLIEDDEPPSNVVDLEEARKRLRKTP